MNSFLKYIVCVVFVGSILFPAILMSQGVNVNRIMLNLTNDGGLDKNFNVPSSWYRRNDPNGGSFFIWNQGLWVTGKRNSGYGWVPYLWRSSFSPGPIINGQPALKMKPEDTSRYKVYTITAGETPDLNPDITAWPADLGAPVDSSGKPRIHGDQTAWTVFNGADTTLLDYLFWNRKLSPRALLPVELRETVFEHFGGFDDTTVWANTVFFEWGIFNKGIESLDSVYLTFWTDIDMNYFISSDIPGVDTSSQTGYCWNKSDAASLSVGYTLLYGPSVPSPNDTAVFFGKKSAGYKNIPLSSFWSIGDDGYADSSLFGPPYSLGTAWNVVRGFMQNGNPIIDSATQLPTKFRYSGDPITKEGSIHPFIGIGGGAGFMMTAGPVTIAPGDSQWIMIALHPSEKLNGVDAINRMRANAHYLRSLPYDSLVSRKARRNVPTKPLPDFTVPTAFKLYSNYPNPFNGETMIPFDLPEKSMVRIEIFDVVGRSVAVLPDHVLGKGYQQVRWFPSVSAGVYFLRINASSVESPAIWSGINKIVLLR